MELFTAAVTPDPHGPNLPVPSARLLAGVAAAKRLSEEEKEIEASCSTAQRDQSTEAPANEQKGTDSTKITSELAVKELNSNMETEVVPLNGDTSSGSEERNGENVPFDEMKEESQPVSEKNEVPNDSGSERYESPDSILMDGRKRMALSSVDDAIAAALGADSAGAAATVDKLLRLRDSLEALLTFSSGIPLLLELLLPYIE